MNISCIINIKGELNFFLPTTKKNKDIEFKTIYKTNVKDAIESVGIPHPEIALIIVNKINVDYNYSIKDNDYIEVYPFNNELNKNPIIELQPKKKPEFMLDVHLGGLAKYLRMAGFDVMYNNEDWGDKYIADKGGKDDRIVLSRDLGLLKRNSVKYGYFVRNRNSYEQFKEIVQRYNLSNHFSPFTRCIKCNGLIKSIEKELILDKIEAGTKRDYHEFWQCTKCEQIYWQGTHFEKMLELLQINTSK